MDIAKVERLVHGVRGNERLAKAIEGALSSPEAAVELVLPCGASLSLALCPSLVEILRQVLDGLDRRRDAAIAEIRSS